MDNRPIGFFDSGLGGLTCIPHLMDRLPEERIIYFGDTARTPYGSKAISTIQSFSNQISDFLVKEDVKMIVIACNTVSATCLEQLRQRHRHIPIVGIIEPATEKINAYCNPNNRIGIIGTKVTVNSHTYLKMIGDKNRKMNVYEKACPPFVPLIEEGIIQSDIMDMTISHYLDDFVLEHRLDTLVLGCTHYPLIRKNLQRKYPGLSLINPSEEVVFKVESILKQQEGLAHNSSIDHRFYASDLSENFANMIDRIFQGFPHPIQFKNLDTVEI